MSISCDDGRAQSRLTAAEQPGRHSFVWLEPKIKHLTWRRIGKLRNGEPPTSVEDPRRRLMRLISAFKNIAELIAYQDFVVQPPIVGIGNCGVGPVRSCEHRILRTR